MKVRHENTKSDYEKLEGVLLPIRKQSTLLFLIAIGATVLNANLLNHNICPVRGWFIGEYLTNSICQPFDLNVIIFGICGLAQLAIAKRHLTLTQLLVPLLVCLFLIWILIYIEWKVMNIGSLPASNYRPQPAWMPVGGLIMSQAMAWAVLINVIGYFGISDNDAA